MFRIKVIKNSTTRYMIIIQKHPERKKKVLHKRRNFAAHFHATYSHFTHTTNISQYLYNLFNIKRLYTNRNKSYIRNNFIYIYYIKCLNTTSKKVHYKNKHL